MDTAIAAFCEYRKVITVLGTELEEFDESVGIDPKMLKYWNIEVYFFFARGTLVVQGMVL